MRLVIEKYSGRIASIDFEKERDLKIVIHNDISLPSMSFHGMDNGKVFERAEFTLSEIKTIQVLNGHEQEPTS